MDAVEHWALAAVKNRFSEVVDRIRKTHGRVVVTKHGQPAAVLISVEDLESLEETLEILSDPQIMEQVRAARKTKPKRLDKEDALRIAHDR